MTKALPFTKASIRRAKVVGEARIVTQPSRLSTTQAIACAEAEGLEVYDIGPDGTIYTKPSSSPQPKEPSFIYFVVGGPFVKIGFSTSVRFRITSLQVGNPYRLSLLNSIPGDVDLERELHRRFSSYRAQGEWFRLEGDLATWIDGGFK
jgi:hypothetical protein